MNNQNIDNKIFRKNINANNRAKRLPICFCIDISLSMDEIVEGEEFCELTDKKVYGDQRVYGKLRPIIPGDIRVKTKAKKLSEGLYNFYEAVWQDDIACDSCVSEIITFRDTARVFEDFESIENKKVPSFPKPNGDTNISNALELALETLDNQIKLYSDNKISCFYPWIVLFTDGEPTDDITKISQKLIERQKDGKLCVYVCPLTSSPYAIQTLEKLIYKSQISNKITGEIIKCDNPGKIKSFFSFLAKSVSTYVGNGIPKGFYDDND